MVAYIKEYKSPLIVVGKEERPENARRLLECYSRAMSNGGKLRLYLMCVASQFLESRNDQEDVLGEYGLRLVKGGAKTYKYHISESEDFLDNPNLMQWTKTSIMNLSRDLLRKKSGKNTFSLSEISDDTLSFIKNSPLENLGPLERLSENERMQEARYTLSRLDPKKRDILSLFYFEGLSYADIARELQIPVGTVKSRLHQAKQDFLMLESMCSSV